MHTSHRRQNTEPWSRAFLGFLKAYLYSVHCLYEAAPHTQGGNQVRKVGSCISHHSWEYRDLSATAQQRSLCSL